MPNQCMPNQLTVTVNETPIAVAAGATVAVAMAIAGQACRTSASGEPRSSLCGMGICFECRVVINGRPHRLGCQILCEQGMEVRTSE